MKRILLLIPALLFVVFTFAQTSKNAYPEKTKLKAISFPGIKGKIFDDKTGAQLAARIVLQMEMIVYMVPIIKAYPAFLQKKMELLKIR